MDGMESPDPENTSQVLPSLYARWMDDHLPGSVPAETEATCDDCAMCSSDGEPQQASGYCFEPSIKCCSVRFSPRTWIGSTDPLE